MTEQDVEQITALIEESDDLSNLAKVAKSVADRIQLIIKQRKEVKE